MPRTRSDEATEQMIQRIQHTARRLMAAHGTSGLTLRGIARELDLSAPALYHYYPRLDDLITALIVADFNSLAGALEAAEAAHAPRPAGPQLLAVLLAYREWAVAHPVDFQLIYGNPIPGYEAPAEQTIPAVVRGFVPIIRVIELALQSGALRPPPPYDAIPAETAAHEAALIAQGGYPVQTLAFHLGMIGWTHVHGITMLELYGHLGPNVGDVALYARSTLTALLTAMGFAMDNRSRST